MSRQRFHSSDGNRHSHPLIYGRGRPELKGQALARIIDREVDEARAYPGFITSARIVVVRYRGQIVYPDRKDAGVDCYRRQSIREVDHRRINMFSYFSSSFLASITNAPLPKGALLGRLP